MHDEEVEERKADLSWGMLESKKEVIKFILMP